MQSRCGCGDQCSRLGEADSGAETSLPGSCAEDSEWSEVEEKTYWPKELFSKA